MNSIAEMYGTMLIRDISKIAAGAALLVLLLVVYSMGAGRRDWDECMLAYSATDMRDWEVRQIIQEKPECAKHYGLAMEEFRKRYNVKQWEKR